MQCKILSNVIKEAKQNNYNRSYNQTIKLKTVWETVKLESGRKNVHEETQVLNIDGKSTNNPQTITNAFNECFLSLVGKKCVNDDGDDDDDNNTYTSKYYLLNALATPFPI